MKNQTQELIKKVIAITAIFILLMLESAFVVFAKELDEIVALSDETFTPPEATSFLEFRATEIKEVPGQNKQVIMELWGNDINFQRI